MAEPGRGGPLAALLRHADAQRQQQGTAQAASQAADDLRGTWQRLRLQQQLKRALAKVPENAGPLNSQRLVQRALQQLQQLSPAYLQHFMAQVETLRWLEQVVGTPGSGLDRVGRSGAEPAPAKPAARKTERAEPKPASTSTTSPAAPRGRGRRKPAAGA